MKRPDELDKLFSNARLEPDRRFVQGLRKRLNMAQGRASLQGVRAVSLRRFGLRALVPVAMVLGVALVLVGVALLRPAPQRPGRMASKGTILISKLYGIATADTLPPPSATTFWDTTQTAASGPAAEACHVYLDGPNPPIRSLMFKDGDVTAFWSKTPGSAVAYMSYSEDPDTPAFDTDTLTASQDSQLRSALIGAVLTDKDGKPLPGDATTALKQTGSYDLYATRATRLKDDSGPMPDCPVQFMHLRIDAASSMFSELDVYNGAVADDKLAFKLTQAITTGTGDFAAEQSAFDAVGFNLEQAKAQQTQADYAHVDNAAAGYQFFYHKSFLGKPTMTELKNADGDVVAYDFKFAKQPQVKYRMYTAKANDQNPKNLAELQATAQAKGWRVLSDDKQAGVRYPGYPQAPTETYMVTDGTTEYGMFASGTPDIPYVYVEAPLYFGQRIVHEPGLVPSTADDVLSLLSVMVFTPGSPVPVGL
jgi:hypothetical protein